MISFVLWLLFFINFDSIFFYLLLAILGLALIVGVLLLKNLMSSLRLKFYDIFGPECKENEGGIYDAFLEMEMMKLSISSKVEMV